MSGYKRSLDGTRSYILSLIVLCRIVTELSFLYAGVAGRATTVTLKCLLANALATICNELAYFYLAVATSLARNGGMFSLHVDRNR